MEGISHVEGNGLEATLDVVRIDSGKVGAKEKLNLAIHRDNLEVTAKE